MRTQRAHLVLCVLAFAHAVFGGVGSAGALCLGGGHEHAASENSQSCEMECAHGAGRLIPAGAEEAPDDCGCVDAEYSLGALDTLTRSDEHDLGGVGLDAVSGWAVDAVGATVSWTGPPARAWLDRGVEQRLAVVTTTRLRL